MNQPAIWGVPRSDGGNAFTPEQYATRDDDSLDALLSGHIGAARPAYAVAGTVWIDNSTTPWTVFQFDGTDDIELYRLHPASNAIRHRFYQGADIASAAILVPGTDGNSFDVTGSVTVTGIASIGIGSVIHFHFDAPLTLTHHATDLVLPGSVDLSVAAGDELTFVEYAAGDWRLISYQRAVVSPLKALTVTHLTSGSGTYIPPPGVRGLRVRAQGAGGGGAGLATVGGTGGNTTFGALTAPGGSTGNLGASFGGIGGVAVSGDINVIGQHGQSTDAVTSARGGDGGNSPFGGAGRGGPGAPNNGQNAQPNTGSGGGGVSVAGGAAGSGGGAGGYLEKYYPVVAASYLYAIGAGGVGGTGANTGGNGADGRIIIEEFY